ncbi:hypothetical protein GCM10010392_69130 [Streptomyces clavifer]|nr:hypothetical protein GCM10010392_69130 [Streptomyces clavifer]
MIANRAIVHNPTKIKASTFKQSYMRTIKDAIIWLQPKRLVHNVQHYSDLEK